MKCTRLVIPSVYKRPSVCKSCNSKITYCCTRKAIAKLWKMLVADTLRRSENRNDILGTNDQIKGRESFALTVTIKKIFMKFCLGFSDINLSFT